MTIQNADSWLHKVDYKMWYDTYDILLLHVRQASLIYHMQLYIMTEKYRNKLRHFKDKDTDKRGSSDCSNSPSRNSFWCISQVSRSIRTSHNPW